ncbi:MAG: recombinase family protein [Oligoflexia bacterium]|nr:recombinase family protein [Oligoflexia bacterium]
METKDLLKILTDLRQSDSNEGSDDYRYVLYARKSTDDKEKQIRSLPDQIKECEELIKRKELKVVGIPIIEKQSAKEPDIRPKFKQMIDDIKLGKYDGIIAWHPDRLARNMREAGDIIDLIDKGVIKDLQFVSYNFDNSASGKMFLGIQFVLSKQYSDQLSVNVSRGIKNRMDEGKYLGHYKHGYYRDNNQFLTPDGKNFALLQEAWQMRKKRVILDEIADYLNKNKYEYSSGIGGVNHKPYKMDKKRLSEIFKDSVYTGVLIYGVQQPVDLIEKYGFEPMVSVDDFLEINQQDKAIRAMRAKFKGQKTGSKKANLLNGLVVCDSCKNELTSGITPKKIGDKTVNYYYFRCDTPGCKREHQSVRAIVIRNFVCDYLSKNKFNSKKIYEHYIQEMKIQSEKIKKQLKATVASLMVEEKRFKTKNDDIKRYLLESKDESIREIFQDDLKGNLTDIKKTAEELAKTRKQLKNADNVVYSYQNFLELFDSLSDRVAKISSLEQLDSVIKKIFLNFSVTGKGAKGGITDYSLNSPFKEFVDKGFVLNGAPRGT